jgi:hypothetical protein
MVERKREHVANLAGTAMEGDGFVAAASRTARWGRRRPGHCGSLQAVYAWSLR